MKKTVSLFVLTVFISIVVLATPQEARADLESAQKTSDTLMVISLACAFGLLALAFVSNSKNNKDKAEALKNKGNLLASSAVALRHTDMNSLREISEEVPEGKVQRIVSFSYNF